MKQYWKLIFALLILLGCIRSSSVTVKSMKDDPPDGVLEDAFHKADYCIEAELLEVEKTVFYQDDAGNPGYVQYVVRAKILTTYKTIEKLDPVISYGFTVEHQPDAQNFVVPGETYIAFLKQSPEDGKYWLFAEGAQFKSTSKSSKLLKSVTDGERASPHQ